MSNYKDVIVESFTALNEQSAHSIRARPLPGQGLAADMRVECSSKMRKSHPVGTKFRIKAKVTDKEGGKPFLYSSFQWGYEVVSDLEADQFIQEHNP